MMKSMPGVKMKAELKPHSKSEERRIAIQKQSKTKTKTKPKKEDFITKYDTYR